MQYDVVIIGSGVAGLTAGIYAGRAGKKVLIIENQMLGGTTATLELIENYPGFEKITGMELVQKIYSQAVNCGVQIEFFDINKIDFENNSIVSSEKIITYGSLIIASGISNKKLNVVGEDEFIYKGLSYCAICDGPLYKNKDLVVVTQGNLGKSSIDYLLNISNKITVLDLSDKYINNNLNVVHNVKVTKIAGDNILKSIEYYANNLQYVIKTDGVFVSLGKEYNLDLYKDTLKIKDNFILSDENMRTNIDGVFVAGDVRYKSLRQIVTACSDGAIAGSEALKYLNAKNNKK